MELDVTQSQETEDGETVESDPTTIIVKENDEGDGDADADADGDLDKPTVDPITDEDTSITGTGTPGATINVVVDGKVIGSGVVDADGNYIITLDDPLAAGVEVELYQSITDEDGNVTKSDSIFVTVEKSGSAGSSGGSTVEVDESDSSGDDTLPKTATSMFDMALAGLMAMLAGIGGLFFRRKKKDNPSK